MLWKQIKYQLHITICASASWDIWKPKEMLLFSSACCYLIIQGLFLLLLLLLCCLQLSALSECFSLSIIYYGLILPKVASDRIYCLYLTQPKHHSGVFFPRFRGFEIFRIEMVTNYIYTLPYIILYHMILCHILLSFFFLQNI